jgi:hypothetical protein
MNLQKKIQGCIICESTSNQESIEHIVPRSLGNIHYILAKGIVCRNCNNRFSRFESKVIASEIFQNERKRLRTPIIILNEKISPLRKLDALRFTTKIGYEALYKSQRNIWNNLSHTSIREFLLHGSLPTPFFDQIKIDEFNFHSIPKWINKWRLRLNHIEVLYGINAMGQVAIQFNYGNITMSSRIA